jgi:hypothetical protein
MTDKIPEALAVLDEMLSRLLFNSSDEAIAKYGKALAAFAAEHEALNEMELEKSNYMEINKLGDPAKEYTNKMARKAIAAVEKLP